jgi:phosphatidylglycerol phospholipase C
VRSDTRPGCFSQPENRHVKFDVDVKVQNDPDRLFSLMHKIISAQPDWETALAPRILLGLWHPRFLDHAKARLPYCRRSYIGSSTRIARKYFWEDCDAFSIAFGALAAYDGQRYAFCCDDRLEIWCDVLFLFLVRFREECKNAGKSLMVWTVNEPAPMLEVRMF